MLNAEEKPCAAGGGSIGRPRRRWSEAQTRQIVAETIGATVFLAHLQMHWRRPVHDTHGWLRPLLPRHR